MVAKKMGHSGAKRSGDAKRNITSGGEASMNLEYLFYRIISTLSCHTKNGGLGKYVVRFGAGRRRATP
jgi:hypothetical protein